MAFPLSLARLGKLQYLANSQQNDTVVVLRGIRGCVPQENVDNFVCLTINSILILCCNGPEDPPSVRTEGGFASPCWTSVKVSLPQMPPRSSANLTASSREGIMTASIFFIWIAEDYLRFS